MELKKAELHFHGEKCGRCGQPIYSWQSVSFTPERGPLHGDCVPPMEPLTREQRQQIEKSRQT